MERKISFEFRITFTYLILGVLWILLSDILAKYLFTDLNKLSYFQSLKGIVFVLISSGVIFLIARHYNRQQQIINKRLFEARKKAEDSERLKSAFLANLSHEIRTPMNGILGFVSLLEETDFQKDKHVMYLEYVKKSSERMLETINDIIEISQIEANQLKVHISEVNVNETIYYLYDLFFYPAEKKGLKLIQNNTLPELIFRIKTDKNKLHSILKIFLKNAIKFSSSGVIELGSFAENNEVVFYVKDNGIGIPIQIQKVIFERFVQADSTISRPYEGSGLGLAIAKAYAELLGGKIWLESEEGKGSTFWFSIPHEHQPKFN